MKIGILGMGYVGQVTSACLASLNHQIVGLDIKNDEVEMLNDGKSSLRENGLEDLLKKNRDNLCFTTDYLKLLGCKVIFICVGTPSDKNGSANLSQVFSAIRRINRQSSKNLSLVVIKSTLPPGSYKDIREKLNSAYSLSVNPEFLREGEAVSDFLKPDRIVLGVENTKSKNLLRKIYGTNLPEKKIIICDPESAILIKSASNAFLATKITFVNEIAEIANSSGANIQNVIKGISKDHRIGKHFLRPGLGFGGSCFPKDLLALGYYKSENNLNRGLIETVPKRNNIQIRLYTTRIIDIVGKSRLKDLSLTILGCSFKPNTNDLRESRSILLAKRLSKYVKKLYVYDPACSENSIKNQLKNRSIKIKDSINSALEETDVLVIATEWKSFRKLDLSGTNIKYLFDPRKCFDETLIQNSKIHYHVI